MYKGNYYVNDDELGSMKSYVNVNTLEWSNCYIEIFK